MKLIMTQRGTFSFSNLFSIVILRRHEIKEITYRKSRKSLKFVNLPNLQSMNLPRLNLRTYHLISNTNFCNNNKLLFKFAKDLSDDEKTALIKVLKSRKQAIAWKLSDIKGINPEFCSHKILMEDAKNQLSKHQEGLIQIS
ncbi:hypothetical protein Tco_0169713 [Tanacetum coccineum]